MSSLAFTAGVFSHSNAVMTIVMARLDGRIGTKPIRSSLGLTGVGDWVMNWRAVTRQSNHSDHQGKKNAEENTTRLFTGGPGRRRFFGNSGGQWGSFRLRRQNRQSRAG